MRRKALPGTTSRHWPTSAPDPAELARSAARTLATPMTWRFTTGTQTGAAAIGPQPGLRSRG
jgi:hypothetical protein